MLQDQQAQHITNQGQIQVPMMEKCTVFLLSPESLFWGTGKQPAPHSRSQAIHSSDLTSWFSWDLTCSSSGLLQVFCPGCNQRSLSNDWPLETETCLGAEHLGSLCMVKLALPSTQPWTILSLCWVVLSLPAATLSWPCHSLSRRVQTVSLLVPWDSHEDREQDESWRMKDHCYTALQKSIPKHAVCPTENETTAI